MHFCLQNEQYWGLHFPRKSTFWCNPHTYLVHIWWNWTVESHAVLPWSTYSEEKSQLSKIFELELRVTWRALDYALFCGISLQLTIPDNWTFLSWEMYNDIMCNAYSYQLSKFEHIWGLQAVVKFAIFCLAQYSSLTYIPWKQARQTCFLLVLD